MGVAFLLLVPLSDAADNISVVLMIVRNFSAEVLLERI